MRSERAAVLTMGWANRRRRVLAAAILTLCLLASFHQMTSPTARANHNENGIDPLMYEPEIWRGWVATQVVANFPVQGGMDVRYRGGWYVDGDRTSTDAVAEATTHEYFESPSHACGVRRKESGGTTKGGQQLTADIGIYPDDRDVKGTGVPLPGEGFSIDADGFGPNYLLQGVNECNGEVSPIVYTGGGYGGNSPPNEAAALGDLSSFPMKLNQRLMDYTYEDHSSGQTFSFQVCMSRSRIDTDEDGLPDDVDLAPTQAAPLRELGIPGGPEQEVIIPKIQGAPVGLERGLPLCPNTPPDEEPCDGLWRSDVLGKEAFGSSELTTFPNHKAACSGLWPPYLDLGFIPQGIAPDGDDIWVSGYYHNSNYDNCAVYRGNQTSGFDGSGFVYPRGSCTHGGGLTVLKPGTHTGDLAGSLVIADTRKLYVVDPDLITGAGDPTVRKVTLDGDGFNGSFLVDDPDPDYLWIGTWKKKGPSTLRRFSVGHVLAADGRLHKLNADRKITIPNKAQGGAFSPTGKLLISSSDSDCGAVSWVDPETGYVNKVRRFGPGSEEIDFIGDRLWATFEAGTMRYPKRFYPLVAEFDPTLLTSSKLVDGCPDVKVGAP